MEPLAGALLGLLAMWGTAPPPPEFTDAGLRKAITELVPEATAAER
jgi:hypothetical protein